MPIIDIEIVDGRISKEMAQELADGIGKGFAAKPGKVWVRVRSLAADAYAENEVRAPKPVFVTVTASTQPQPPEMRARLAYIIAEVARVTGRPAENIHVEFLPGSKGRIAFGGKLVE